MRGQDSTVNHHGSCFYSSVKSDIFMLGPAELGTAPRLVSCLALLASDTFIYVSWTKKFRQFVS